jgi:hypothetical protein
MHRGKMTVRAKVDGVHEPQERTVLSEARKLKEARKEGRRLALEQLYGEYPGRKVTVLATHWDKLPFVPDNKRADAGQILRPGDEP